MAFILVKFPRKSCFNIYSKNYTNQFTNRLKLLNNQVVEDRLEFQSYSL